jgi:HlyD family secretion protein
MEDLKRLLIVGILVAVAAAGVWLALRKSAPPEVPFLRATRQTVESTVTTNGRAEPVEWAAVRAERAGPVETVAVDKGQFVTKGAVIAELRADEPRAELAAAQARIEQARAQAATVERGGAAPERAEIDRELARARLDRDAAQKDVDALTRLVKQQAATAQELTAARQRLEQAEADIRGLEQKRSGLVSGADKSVAEAQLRDAQAAAALAGRNIEESVIRAPLDGAVYELDVRPGAYLNPGDPVASVGRLDRLRVVIYVDEPELGRVAKGMPVRSTWDALPGRVWKGEVDRVPAQITALGNRQVGEVVALIDNPGRSLLPGTNVNAEIESEVVANALSVPKEAIRRRGTEVGVYLLVGDHIVWRTVTIGASSITRAEVRRGLKEGDAVAEGQVLAVLEV